MVIDDGPVDATSGQTFDVVGSADGVVIATVFCGVMADVDLALAAARRAFDERGGWSG
jgi:acyl-CoA reductase-like NAD-dependent aldehyde dehydrogenase